MVHRRIWYVPHEDMERCIVANGGMNNLRASKPRATGTKSPPHPPFLRTFSRETFHEAMEICLDRGAYSTLMLTDTARSIQKRKIE